MKIVLFFTVLLLLFSSNNSLAQGPIDGFMKNKNELDLALSGGYQTAQYYIGANGPFEYNRSFYQAGVFGNYGLTDKINLIANIPFIGKSFQDAGLYGKFKIASLLNDKLNLISALGYSLPIQNYNTENALSIGQQAHQIQGKFLVQYQLPAGWAIQAQSGYNYAFEPVPSSFLASGKVLYASSNWYFDLWYAYQNSFGNKVYLGPEPFDSFRELATDFYQVGGVIYRKINGQLGAFVNASQILGGLGTYTTFSATTGVVLKF